MQTSAKAIFCTLITLVLALVLLPQSASGSSFGGIVTDAKTHQPVGSARVVLELWLTNQALTTFTNSSGVFSFTVPSEDKALSGRLILSGSGYKRFEKPVNVSTSSKPEEIELDQASQSIATTSVRQARSGPIPSFAGTNWSDWCQVCSDPLQNGEAIGGSVTFRLIGGDRICGAWSECRETIRDASRVCWQFRLQGHGEWAGPFGTTLPRSGPPNIGELTYEVVKTEQIQIAESSLGNIAVQFAGSQNDAAVKNIAKVLVQKGFQISDYERIDKNYVSEVKYFHEEDAGLAAQIQTVVKQSLPTGAGIQPTRLAFVHGFEDKTRFHYIEIWLH